MTDKFLLSDRIRPGIVVKSRAGHDKNKYFVVLSVVDDEYVLIADGKSRTAEKPKKKKLRHLWVCREFFPGIQETLNNNGTVSDHELRRLLAEYIKTDNQHEEA